MTHLDQLNKLPEPIRSQAIENTRASKGELADEWLGKPSKSLCNTIEFAFIWHETPQVEDDRGYWCRVFNRADAGRYENENKK